MSWTLGDFVFAGALLFGALGAYGLTVRRTGNTPYRAAVGLALASAVILVWANAAVGVTDSAADALYAGVPAVGIIGALVARFRAHGMARAMLAAAIAQMAIGVVALLAGMVPAYNSAFEVLGITAFFAALFIGSALLFRQAARRGL